MCACVCVFNPVMTKSSYKEKEKFSGYAIFLASFQDVLSVDLGKYACPCCTRRNFDTWCKEIQEKGREEVSWDEGKQMTVACDRALMTSGSAVCDQIRTSTA